MSVLRKQTSVWRVFSARVTMASFTLFSVLSPAAFAAQGSVLNDEEMDSVFAQGFTVSFDISVAKVGAMPAKVPAPVAAPVAPLQTAKRSQIADVPKPSAPTAPQVPSLKTAAPAASATSSGNTSGPGLGASGLNAVMVTDRSQQFLNSLININAAGSLVPVLLNLMVNINSTIYNALNTNTLDIDNYHDLNLPVSALTASPVPAPPASLPAVTEAPSTSSGFPAPVQPPDFGLVSEPVPGPAPSQGAGLESVIPQAAEPGPTAADPLLTPLLAAPASEVVVNEPSQPASQGLQETFTAGEPLTNLFPDLQGTSGGGDAEFFNPAPETAPAPSDLSFDKLTSLSGDSAGGAPEPAVTPLAEPVPSSTPTAGIPGGSQDPAGTLGSEIAAGNPAVTLVDAVEQMPAADPLAVFDQPGLGAPSDLAGDAASEVSDAGTLTDSSLGAPISISASEVTPPAGQPSGAQNLVYVGNTAQQYLSSLINVNAAGSVVPILVNFVININSTVQNIQNTNKLNFEDHYRYYFR